LYGQLSRSLTLVNVPFASCPPTLETRLMNTFFRRFAAALLMAGRWLCGHAARTQPGHHLGRRAA
jgi:hypothetical protein